MSYTRPQNPKPLSKDEKIKLLREYFGSYEQTVSDDPTALNRKVPRVAFAELLDGIGSLLLEESRKLASEPGIVRNFLKDNPLPESMASLLPDKFRVFCLALNALKQWVSAEQSATDRYLLGGVARELCRKVATKDLVTGKALGSDIELHHPLRDGRPPLPLSREGHARLENQVPADSSDPVELALVRLKREGNRSWAMLRRGCEELIGRGLPASKSPNSAASARAFARKTSRETALGYAEILEWLDVKGL